MLTRTEARMIARELYSLWKEDHEEMVGVRDAARICNVSTSYIYHKLDEIPHSRMGGSLKFRPSALREYMNQ